jgi:hypothetical protein
MSFHFLPRIGEDRMRPITIVIAEGFSDWEIAPLAGVGRSFYGADIRFTSPSGGPVTSAAGLTIGHTEIFEAPNEGVVVVCGGPAYEADATPTLPASFSRRVPMGASSLESAAAQLR